MGFGVFFFMSQVLYLRLKRFQYSKLCMIESNLNNCKTNYKNFIKSIFIIILIDFVILILHDYVLATF